MRVPLDTHLLLWSVGRALRLSQQAKEIILDSSVKLSFGPVSIWEVAIKNVRGSPDFQVHPRRLFEDLVNRGYYEIPMRAEHALAVADLPNIHKDPFGRMLVGQATTESVMLLTSDRVLAQYPGPIQLV